MWKRSLVHSACSPARCLILLICSARLAHSLLFGHWRPQRIYAIYFGIVHFRNISVRMCSIAKICWRRGGDFNEFDKKVLKHTKWVIISIRIYISIYTEWHKMRINSHSHSHLHSVCEIPVRSFVLSLSWDTHTNCVNSLPFYCHFVSHSKNAHFFSSLSSICHFYQAHWFNGIFMPRFSSWIFFSQSLSLSLSLFAYCTFLCVWSSPCQRARVRAFTRAV